MLYRSPCTGIALRNTAGLKQCYWRSSPLHGDKEVPPNTGCLCIAPKARFSSAEEKRNKMVARLVRMTQTIETSVAMNQCPAMK